MKISQITIEMNFFFVSEFLFAISKFSQWIYDYDILVW